MTGFATILYEQQDGGARITLNRPERANAPSQTMLAEIGAELDATALAVARHLAAIDPVLLKRTKHAINRSLRARGLLGALEEALTIDLLIEREGSPDKLRLMEIRRRDGFKAALAWRGPRFPQGTP
jgi:enoyl-CoA hydratase